MQIDRNEFFKNNDDEFVHVNALIKILSKITTTQYEDADGNSIDKIYFHDGQIFIEYTDKNNQHIQQVVTLDVDPQIQKWINAHFQATISGVTTGITSVSVDVTDDAVVTADITDQSGKKLHVNINDFINTVIKPAIADMETKTDANNRFQPKGDYATKSDISDMETKTDAKNLYQPKGDYANKSDISDMETKTDAKATYQPIGTYATADQIKDMETKTDAKATYQPIGDYLSGVKLLSDYKNPITQVASKNTVMLNGAVVANQKIPDWAVDFEVSSLLLEQKSTDSKNPIYSNGFFGVSINAGNRFVTITIDNSTMKAKAGDDIQLFYAFDISNWSDNLKNNFKLVFPSPKAAYSTKAIGLSIGHDTDANSLFIHIENHLTADQIDDTKKTITAKYDGINECFPIVSVFTGQ